MKKIIYLFALAVIMISCGSTGNSAVSTESRQSMGADDYYASDNSSAESAGSSVISDVTPGIFSDVSGKEWKLSEINLVNSIVIFDRDKLIHEGFSDIFTLNFSADMVSGKGEPNRYSAPYTRENQKISIMPMRSTLMASIFPNETLNEHEFFLYLQNVYEWKLTGNYLELLSKTADGNEARLVWIASE